MSKAKDSKNTEAQPQEAEARKVEAEEARKAEEARGARIQRAEETLEAAKASDDTDAFGEQVAVLKGLKAFDPAKHDPGHAYTAKDGSVQYRQHNLVISQGRLIILFPGEVADQLAACHDVAVSEGHPDIQQFCRALLSERCGVVFPPPQKQGRKTQKEYA